MVNGVKIKLDYGVKKHLPRASCASERVFPSSVQAICASVVYVVMERRIFFLGGGEHPIQLSLKEEGIKSEWHTPATALTLLRAELPRW